MCGNKHLPRRRSAQILRALTEYKISYRAYIGGTPLAITQLIEALLQSKNGLEEDLLCTVHNVAIQEQNKRVLGQNAMLVMCLMNGLRPGISETTRIKSAYALSSFSYLESNQELMGEFGLVKASLDVLFKLCETDKNIDRLIADGGIECLFEKISQADTNSMLKMVNVIESITTTNRMAAILWRNTGGVQLLASLIKAKESHCHMGTKHSCLGCLFNIIENVPGAWKEVRQDEDLMTTLVKLDKIGTPVVQGKAIKLMGSLNSHKI